MIGLGIVLAHLVGDYLLQSHWMATEKTRRWWPAVAHGLLYTLPHIFVTRSIIALAFICGTHILIDHYRLARYVVVIKNHIAPQRYHPRLDETSPVTGFPLTTPTWLASALLIVVDNTLHLLLNTFAVVAL